MSRSAYDVQKDFALSCGLRSEIIWDALSPDQQNILKQKIEALIPNDGKRPRAIEKMRRNIFENTWSQRKYTNGILLSSIIYVLVVRQNIPHISYAKYSKSFSCHPVVRTRKCINSNAGNSDGCCMIFIDETGRIYQNWKSYQQNNVLPAGIMVAPLNGVYTFDANDENVLLEYLSTPAANSSTQLLKKGDNVATVGSVVAMVPIIGALAFPVGATVLTTASVIAAATTAYSVVRSAIQLVDRGKHGQSVALTDRAARKDWIGIASGVVGVGAVGATKALTSTSQVTMAAKLAVSGVNVSSILVSGTGVVNGVHDLVLKIKDNEKVVVLDILQLSSSLIVFTHSINNIRLASNIAAYNDGSSVRSRLQSELKNSFLKIIRRQTPTNGDIIRIPNDIPLKAMLINLHKMHTQISSSTVTATAATYIPKVLSYINSNGGFQINFSALAAEFGTKFVSHIVNSVSFLDVLDTMAQYFCERVFGLLLNLTRIIIDENVDPLESTINSTISTENVLFRIFKFCISNYKDFSYHYMENHSGEILNNVETYFRSLNPNRTDNLQKCKDCKGYYYICNL